MVDVEYRMEDYEPVWQKILYGVAAFLLILLIPSTALGYFAEKSIPGQMLYPVKRAIEKGVLSLESLTPYGKTNYLLALGDTRVTETSALVAEAKTTGDYQTSAQYSDAALVDLVNSVRAAQTSIQGISDPVQKKRAEQTLANSIQKYQNSLQRIVVVVNEPATTFAGMQAEESDTPTLTPKPAAMNEGLTTPTPDPTLQTESQQQVADQIQQTQTDLQQIQQQLSVSPDPALLLTPTLVPSVSPSPTLTSFRPKRRGNGDGGRNGD